MSETASEPQPASVSGRTAVSDQPVSIIIFGASGDLTQRKLVPALYNLVRKHRLGTVDIIGSSRTGYSHDEYRQHLLEGVAEHDDFDQAGWDEFAGHIHYVASDATTPEGLRRLDEFVIELEQGRQADTDADEAGEASNRLYYLSVAPNLYQPIIEGLGQADMVTSGEEGWRRIVIEKPFGRDYASAQALNETVHRVVDENAVYRIDHYLGKGDRTEYPVLPVCQHDLRAGVEPQLHRQYPDNCR